MILTYARVSTTEQAADGTTSIEEQTRKCRAVADLRGAGSYDVVDYADRGVSGSIPLGERDAGRDMLAAAAPGDVIVAAKMDRLFRSATDALVTAEKLKKRGVELVLIDMGVEPVTANGAAKMFFGMLALVAEFERERIAERMEDGRRGKRDRNGHMGGSAPYGYRVDGVGRAAVLVPDDQEQGTLKVLLDLSNQGRPSFVIRKARDLKLVNRTGKPFDFMQVKRIVKFHERRQQAH